MPTIWYNEYKNFIEKSINNYLEKYFDKNYYLEALENIKTATFYAVSGGKRIRAILALEFYLILSGKTINDIKLDDDITKFCIALELIHSYSLVHDDLPEIDNDEYRRGELTVWKKFGEANGILIGDLLNTLSFEVLSEISDEKIGLRIVKLLSNSTGFYGMIGGQIEDIFFEKNFYKLTLEKLISLHSKKTGALIGASVSGGIILSGKIVEEKYHKYAKNIGLAFQIKDDILDFNGTFEETGKSIGGEKKGFVYFLGLQKSHEYLEKLITESLEIISELNSEKLEFLTNYIASRNK